MSTLRDVALKARVDVSTASKVLSGREIQVKDSTRRRIEAAARSLGYTPNAYARGLRMQRKGAIAMVVWDTTNLVFPEIVQGAEEAAERLGIGLFLVRHTDVQRTERLLSIIRQDRMDGWIFADHMPDEAFVSELRKAKIRFVTLDRVKAGPGPYVCLDDEAGFRVQAEQIVAQGHRKVAFVAVEPECYVTRLCRHSFLKSMAGHFLPLPPSHVLGGDFVGRDAERLAETIVNLRPRPTAVACGSMQMATRLIEALLARGIKVPEEIGVVGYHDPPNALVSRPPLTTVRMPSRAQGRIAVERLVELVEGKRRRFDGEILSEPPEFVVRESLRLDQAG